MLSADADLFSLRLFASLRFAVRLLLLPSSPPMPFMFIYYFFFSRHAAILPMLLPRRRSLMMPRCRAAILILRYARLR